MALAEPSVEPCVRTGIDRDGGTGTAAQWGVVIAPIDADAHRHALHNLYPVARRILCGQHGELGAGRLRDARHLSRPFVARVGIDLDGHGLACPDPFKVGFLEVGFDVNAAVINDGERRTACLDAVAHLRQVTDDARPQRTHHRVLEIDPCLLERSQRRQHRGMLIDRPLRMVTQFRPRPPLLQFQHGNRANSDVARTRCAFERRNGHQLAGGQFLLPAQFAHRVLG